MKVEVDLNGRYADVAPLFENYPEAMEQVCAKVEEKAVAIEAMTVKDLCELLDGRVPSSLLRQHRNDTVAERAAIVLGLRTALERFGNFMCNTVPPATPQQKKYASGLLDTSAEESVLLTCKDFYNLHGLEEAQKLTVYEYMIARKAIYNERMQSYNMEMDAMRRRPAAGRM